MKQINKEFTEILLTKTQGKMLERLSVREYDMGTCLPVISNIAVVKDEKDEDNHNKPTVRIMLILELLIVVLKLINSFIGVCIRNCLVCG